MNTFALLCMCVDTRNNPVQLVYAYISPQPMCAHISSNNFDLHIQHVHIVKKINFVQEWSTSGVWHLQLIGLLVTLRYEVCIKLCWSGCSTSPTNYSTPPTIIEIWDRCHMLLMEEILHQLGCIKPCKWWDKLPINWYRIPSINRSQTNIARHFLWPLHVEHILDWERAAGFLLSAQCRLQRIHDTSIDCEFCWIDLNGNSTWMTFILRGIISTIQYAASWHCSFLPPQKKIMDNQQDEIRWISKSIFAMGNRCSWSEKDL